MSYRSEDILWKVDEDTNTLRAYHADNPTKPVAWAPQDGSQVKFLSCPIDEVLLEGNRGGGKAQPLDAKVLTPFGWVQMGNLCIGDEVLTPGGFTTKVTHVFDHEPRQVYHIKFKDGGSTEACAEHLWRFEVAGAGRSRIESTVSMERWKAAGGSVSISPVSECVIQPGDTSPRCRRYLESVTPSRVVPTRCIRIDHPDHLYITDDYIVTHNTDVLLMDYAQHVGQGYGKDWNGILFRRTYKELDDVRLKSDKWFTEIFPTATFNKSANVWTFADGEKLRFAVADTLVDYNKYHGHAYTWMAWEELTNWPDDGLFKKLLSLNRSSNPNIPKKIRATTNPSGPGHNWIRKRYGLPSLPGRGQTEVIQEPDRPARIAIQSRLDENKVLLHADPNYINKLLEACDSPEQERAWVYGDWDITSGGMFDDVWLPKHHILQDFPIHRIPEGWKIDRSYDHGQSKPFSVGFWAQSNGERMTLPDGRVVGQVRGDLIRIGEWYGCDPKKDNTGIRLTAKEIAQGILDRVEDMGLTGRMRPGPADASIFDQVEANKSVAGDMKRLGVKWLAADKVKGSRKQGWQQVRTLLKQAIPQRSEDGNYLRESPGLFVTDRCVDFIRTFPVLSRDKKDVDDVDTNIEDHIADEVRYRCRAKLAKRTRVTKG